LQAGIDEIRRHVGDLGIVRMLRIDDRHLVPAGKRGEFRHLEAVMAHFERVLQLEPVQRFRQELQEALEIVGLELLRRRELPEDRAEMVAELGQSLRQEFLHRLAAVGQHLAVRRETVRLEREDEPIGHLGRPFGKGLRLL